MSICGGYGMGVCTVMNCVCKIFTMVIQARFIFLSFVK